MVKLQKSKPAAGGGGGPSSAIGIMRFSDADKTNLMLSPVFIVFLTLFFIAVILVMKNLGA